MAVLDELSVAVTVMIDGQPAREYEDDDDPEPDADNSVNRYIEVVSGQEYSFHIQLNPGFVWENADTVCVRPFIDGQRHTGICLAKAIHLQQTLTCGFIRGEWSGSGSNAQLHKFAFVDLETRDIERTDDVSKMKDNYGKLGTFSVQLWREQAISHGEELRSNFVVEPLKPIPEKALKGRPLDVATSYKTTPGIRPGITRTITLERQPFATFNFKPRTRKALQTLMIIERSPTPVPLEERPLDQLTREELEEVVRRQRVNSAIKKENQSLKRERANTLSTPMPPLKTSRGANGQTIYHLDSDDDDGGNEAEVITL